jgi:hypothetical protein
MHYATGMHQKSQDLFFTVIMIMVLHWPEFFCSLVDRRPAKQKKKASFPVPPSLQVAAARAGSLLFKNMAASSSERNSSRTPKI